MKPHLYVRHIWLSAILKKFNTDPYTQYKIHLAMTYVWVANALIAIAVFIFAQAFWQKFSVLYLVIVSLYANFATDYGAVPGAEAAISSDETSKKLK